MKTIMRHTLAISLSTCLSSAALAAGADEPRGLWLTEQKDAVIEFKSCPDETSALCGKIVWDKDAGKAADTCGVQIAKLSRYERDAWRDGWIYDPRDKKKYKGVVKVKDGMLQLRAFVGAEILGQTEQLSRVDSLPATPSCKL